MSHETPTQNIPDDEIDLRELILTLIKGWKIILVCTIVCAIGVAIYAYRLPDQYVVVTKAATVGGGGAGSQMAGLAALAGVNIGGGEKEVDLLQHIDVVIKNTYFMDKLLEKEWVISRKQTKQEIKDRTPLVYDTLRLEEYWEYPEPDTTVHNWDYLRKRSLYGLLRSPKRGHISVENSDGILEVRTKFDNAELAYQVHEELLRLLKEYFKNDYTSRDREKRKFVEERLNEVDAELKGAEARLMRFREKNIMATAPRVLLEGERLKREVELQASLFSELTKQLEIAKIDEKKEVPVFEVLQAAELPLGPSDPNRKIMMIMSAFFGIGLGAVVVFVLKYIRDMITFSRKSN